MLEVDAFPMIPNLLSETLWSILQLKELWFSKLDLSHLPKGHTASTWQHGGSNLIHLPSNLDFSINHGWSLPRPNITQRVEAAYTLCCYVPEIIEYPFSTQNIFVKLVLILLFTPVLWMTKLRHKRWNSVFRNSWVVIETAKTWVQICLSL